MNVAWSVRSLETDENTGTYLAGYTMLKELRWNQIKRHNFLVIYQIVEGNVCPKLKRLFLNLASLDSTGYAPTTIELDTFRQLYAELQGRMRPAKNQTEPAITVFFNDVQLDFNRFFNDYAFGQRLADLHLYNLANDPPAVSDHRSVTRVDYLKLPIAFFELNRREFNLEQFAQLYQNIRVVVLNRVTNEEQTIEAEQFVRFLKSCTALVVLDILHSLFPAALYTRLAKEVKSLSTLGRFVLMEPYEFKHSINVRFLNALPYLRQLRTNLATRQTMFELAERMSIGAVYKFEFCHLLTDYICRIERLNDVNVVSLKPQSQFQSRFQFKSRWSLLVQRRTRESGTKKSIISELYRQTSSFTYLKNYFLCRPNLLVSEHWLDNVETSL